MSAIFAFSRRATVAAAIFAATVMPVVNTPARADDTSGAYAVASGAIVWRARAGENSTTFIDFEPGDAFNVAFGYAIKRTGFEFEYSHVSNWTQTVAATATGPAPGLGNVSLDFKMVNLRYELSKAGPITPYVSVGAGEYESHLNFITNPIANSFGLVANGTSYGETLAYQARAGVGLKLAKNVQLLLGYRFLRGGNLVFKDTAFGLLTPNGATLNQIEIGAMIKQFGH